METKDLLLPDRDFALELMKELKLPISIRFHSLQVAKKALEIANKITKVKLNKDLIEMGALLHDIGRTKTHGFKHALIGGKILRERGFPGKLARICETHILGGLDEEDSVEVGIPEKDYLPVSIEEKIVCLADKYMTGRFEVTIEERFKKWFLKYGRTNILEKAKKRIEEIQKEIESLM
jgi:uncharacterized protein